ncbi:MAG: UbiA family prenyltransferase [Gemmatimonadota bacterium]|nr:UbiA family prenyltransferase [Gemmatimonadota bacterium]MDH4349951.1 UbiA family prenyltransferase [Gemmatimonadota bacterium]MDH5196875.1 UbiA family prenyltransferase [Gemmatimonadota bacterium]
MTTLAHIAAPARLLTARFWRDYVVTMRPYLLFVSGITGIAGLAMAPDAERGAVVALAVVFFLTYGFGQALTDCFQLDTDSLSAPYRPLVRGALRREDVLAVSLTGLLASGLVIGSFEPATLPLCGLAIGGLATYTWFKRRWWGGPLYNAWIIALVLFIAARAAGPVSLGSPVLLGALAAALFGYANFVLVGYYKDLSADRATGYRTLPVVFGLPVANRVSDGFAVLAFVGALASATASILETGVAGWVAASPFALAAGAATALAQHRTHRVTCDRDAHTAISPVVHAYVFLLATVAAAARPAWAPALVLFYVGFVFTLRHRPMAEQI